MALWETQMTRLRRWNHTFQQLPMKRKGLLSFEFLQSVLQGHFLVHLGHAFLLFNASITVIASAKSQNALSSSFSFLLDNRCLPFTIQSPFCLVIIVIICNLTLSIPPLLYLFYIFTVKKTRTWRYLPSSPICCPLKKRHGRRFLNSLHTFHPSSTTIHPDLVLNSAF